MRMITQEKIYEGHIEPEHNMAWENADNYCPVCVCNYYTYNALYKEC